LTRQTVLRRTSRSTGERTHATPSVRRRLPLPPEQREKQPPFVIDIRSMRFIAPWSRKRPLPGDEERLDALLARRLGAGAGPTGIRSRSEAHRPAGSRHARDRAVYRLAA
jgi:hypothetical protein